MKRDRFISLLKTECATRDWLLVIDKKLGKGSHYRIEVWSGANMLAKTTLKSGELSPVYMAIVRKQLGLKDMDFICELGPNGGGGLIVQFPDVPEALTEGATEQEALANAADALEVALLGRMKDGDDIPAARRHKSGTVVHVSAQASAKLAFYAAFRRSGLSQSALARRIGKDEAEVRRMLDPYHATKLPALDEALRALGQRFVVSVEAA